MNVLFTIMIIILIVSNVILWICFKGLSIMFKKLCDQCIELGECILKEENDDDTNRCKD